MLNVLNIMRIPTSPTESIMCRYEDRTLARGGQQQQQQQNNSHATNGAAAYSVMPLIVCWFVCLLRVCVPIFSLSDFNQLLSFQADSVPMESLSLYSGAGRGGGASGASIYPPGQHMVTFFFFRTPHLPFKFVKMSTLM